MSVLKKRLQTMEPGYDRMALARSMGFTGQAGLGLLALAQEGEPGGKPMSGAEKRAAEKELKRALGMEASKTPDYQRKMLKLNELMAKLGGSLLATVITGLGALLATMKWMGLARISTLTPWNKENERAAARALGDANKWGQLAEKSAGRAWAVASQAMQQVPDLLGGMFEKALTQGLREFRRAAGLQNPGPPIKLRTTEADREAERLTELYKGTPAGGHHIGPQIGKGSYDWLTQTRGFGLGEKIEGMGGSQSQADKVEAAFEEWSTSPDAFDPKTGRLKPAEDFIRSIKSNFPDIAKKLTRGGRHTWDSAVDMLLKAMAAQTRKTSGGEDDFKVTVSVEVGGKKKNKDISAPLRRKKGKRP